MASTPLLSQKQVYFHPSECCIGCSHPFPQKQKSDRQLVMEAGEYLGVAPCQGTHVEMTGNASTALEMTGTGDDWERLYSTASHQQIYHGLSFLLSSSLCGRRTVPGLTVSK